MENEKPENPKAFPLHEDLTSTEHMGQQGMTLRDYFAAKALQGLVSQETYPLGKGVVGYGVSYQASISEWSYKIADAMLKERSK